MMFYDEYSLVIDLSSVIMIVKATGIDERGVGSPCIRYILQNGQETTRDYPTEAERERQFTKIASLLAQLHREKDQFELRMREHAIKGMNHTEKHAEEEGRGW